ncbi:MAG: uracil phosphoribosyltransferase [Bacteroidetes bacterium]|nr:MAG: uracil phosphoribosyltransferase [Bacteroidota bacterium]
MIHELSKTNSVFGIFLGELRDVNIQNDSLRFRRNLERISEIMAYEISKTLEYQEEEVTTPLGKASVFRLKQQPVIATILRAGLPMHQGLLNYFDRAENAFVSAYRKHHSPEEFDIHVEYMAAPSIDGKTLIISDPMLATGGSMVLVYKSLLEKGRPKQVIVATAIAAPEAIDYVKQHLPSNVQIYVGSIDEELTAESYIVPGLGDAGDLAYGPKE